MPESNQIELLLTEIRDLLASREQQYKQYLADSEGVYERQIKAAQKRVMLYRPLQWATLFMIVYGAVYFALKSAG